jgi:carboxyl-terminal processing protease
MKAKKIVFVLLVMLLLSCNVLTQATRQNPPTTIPITGNIPMTETAPANTSTPEPVSINSVTYLPPGCQNIALATIPAATTIAEPTPSLGVNPEITSETQLKVFEALVSKIEQVYLYPDFNGIDWQSVTAAYRAKIKTGLDTETFYNEMNNLISELKDDHSQFQSPVQLAKAQAELAGHNDFVGIGALILPLPDKERVSILAVFPDSAADHAGLKPHDSILATDGIPIVSDGKVFVQHTRGPLCSAVTLTVQSPNEEPREVMVVRFRINAPVPIDARLVTTRDGSKIGYIFLPSFFDETIPAQVKKVLEEFGQLDGLILDNRMNGGGSSDVLNPVLAYFTHGNLGNFVTRTSQRSLEIKANLVNNSQEVPLVVLVGPETVSFGEIFAGVLQDTGRALLVGKTTLGNVEVLHSHDFEDGSRLWLAQERFDPLISHANWEKDGIVPDVEAFADWDTFTFDSDPSIAAALKLLGHQ